MKVIKDKCKILRLGWVKAGNDRLGSRFAEEDWGVLGERRLYVFWRCTLVMMEAGLVLGGNGVWFWAPSINKTDDKLER